MDVRPHWWTLLALLVTAVPGTALAEPLIPWPWLESNRYQTWQSEREQAKADWYARRALDPVGSRQRYVKGKDWPPYPRPEGISQLPSHRYHAAHYWPHPYMCQDRNSVRELIAAHETAGWTDHTTFFDYHFEPDTQTLNRSGRLHLQSILRNAPPQHRQLYVQAGDNMTASELRMASVQAETAEMVGSGQVPVIQLRVTSTIGRAAADVDLIQRGQNLSQPIPRISPPISGSGTVAPAAK